MKVQDLKLPGIKDVNETILRDGVFIGNRPGLFCQIALFQINDFYVEVFYDAKSKEVSRARTFTDVSMLDPYLKQIDLAALLN